MIHVTLVLLILSKKQLHVLFMIKNLARDGCKIHYIMMNERWRMNQRQALIQKFIASVMASFTSICVNSWCEDPARPQVSTDRCDWLSATRWGKSFLYNIQHFNYYYIYQSPSQAPPQKKNKIQKQTNQNKTIPTLKHKNKKKEQNNKTYSNKITVTAKNWYQKKKKLIQNKKKPKR